MPDARTVTVYPVTLVLQTWAFQRLEALARARARDRRETLESAAAGIVEQLLRDDARLKGDAVPWEGGQP